LSWYQNPLFRLLGLLEIAKFTALNLGNWGYRPKTVQDFTLRFTQRFEPKAPNNGFSEGFEKTYRGV
jgi:hypothetical protein